MLKYFLVFSLAVPLCGHCQSYAHSPSILTALPAPLSRLLYGSTSAIPSTAHAEGWSRLIKANGVVIDLFESEALSSPEFDEIEGWSVHSWVDRNRPGHVFHYFIQYDRLNVVFGYDLLVEPVQGTDEIRCTFSALTDPEINWHRDKDIPVVVFPTDLAPLVMKSGDTIAITTLPLGQGRIPVIHYLRLTRTDLTIAKGEQLMTRGNETEALAEFQSALDSDPRSSVASYRIGEILLRQHDYQASVNAFRDSLREDGDPSWTKVWSHIQMGKIFDITGQRDRAVNEYQLALQTKDNTRGAIQEAQHLLSEPYLEQRRE